MFNIRKILHNSNVIPIKIGEDGGMFKINTGYSILNVVASYGDGWDHVSVSKNTMCPNWDEMNFIKDLFFDENEVVMQLHPKKTEYVNNHPYCLHLWRPQNAEIPTPPLYMV